MNKWFVAIVILFSSSLHAAMQKEEITYQHGDTQLKGYLFWDTAFEGKRPGVMVVHEWWGLNDYALLRAEMLAESGYVAFAADMYGQARMTRHAENAEAWMQQITQNVDTWQQRAQIGLEQLLKQDKVDAEKTAAIGFCFGGATVMQLAYSGADLDGVISVHGSLPTASKEQTAAIKPRVLVLHGAADNFIPKQQIEQFTTALEAEGVNWEMISYGGAVHGFSNPYADGYGIKGLAYHEQAEQNAWARTLSFLQELFEERF